MTLPDLSEGLWETHIKTLVWCLLASRADLGSWNLGFQITQHFRWAFPSSMPCWSENLFSRSKEIRPGDWVTDICGWLQYLLMEELPISFSFGERIAVAFMELVVVLMQSRWNHFVGAVSFWQHLPETQNFPVSKRNINIEKEIKNSEFQFRKETWTGRQVLWIWFCHIIMFWWHAVKSCSFPDSLLWGSWGFFLSCSWI
jgi:hypothetical protein